MGNMYVCTYVRTSTQSHPSCGLLFQIEERPQDSVCVMLDWFSAHLHEDVRQLIVEEKGHCLLFHGGGVTGVLQPNDTHVHEPLSKEFKRLEQRDVSQQRRLNNGKIPQRTRQKVYDDCHLAWDSIDHDYVGPKSHLQDGWTLPLDGSRDDEIYHDLEPIWNSPALDMFTARQKLIDEVNQDITDRISLDLIISRNILREIRMKLSFAQSAG